MGWVKTWRKGKGELPVILYNCSLDIQYERRMSGVLQGVAITLNVSPNDATLTHRSRHLLLTCMVQNQANGTLGCENRRRRAICRSYTGHCL